MQKYYVSRQCYWPNGDLFVEIVVGGRNEAGPDQITPRFENLEEGEEFFDPREALDCAKKIKEAWSKLTTREIHIGFGSTHGGSLPLEPMTDEELESAIEKHYEKLPKCDYCSEFLDLNQYFGFDYSDDEKFCSESCLEEAKAEQLTEELKAEILVKYPFTKFNLSGDWNVTIYPEEKEIYIRVIKNKKRVCLIVLDEKTRKVKFVDYKDKYTHWTDTNIQ